MKKRTQVHQGRRFEVSAFIPSAQLQAIAHERTEGIVGYFLACSSRDPVKWQHQLYVLARSCYMQGLNDAIDSAARTLRCAASEEGK